MSFGDVLHNVRDPYRCSPFKTVYNCCEAGFGHTLPDKWPFCCKHIRKLHSDQSYSSSYDLVFGSVRGLHYMWLVFCTRASFDSMDNSDSGEWIYLKGGVVPWRAWPNQSTWTLHHALRWDGLLVESQEGLETKVGPRANLINSGQTEAQARCKDHLVIIVISTERQQIPYSAAVDLVARWIYQESTLVSEFSGTTPSSSYSLREIVPERDPIPMIDLSDSETVEGRVVLGVELGVSIEEDPSEPKSDGGMVPEPEEVATVDVELVSTSTGVSEGRYAGDDASSGAEEPHKKGERGGEDQEKRGELRGRQLLAQLQSPINVMDKDYGNIEIPRDPVASKEPEMEADKP
ncbi:hypothetical protein M9H77_03314 [Catharanthus roseus]|uniref:Uncharacterized protein n=1 Tax=Catharanthus roseus TaxID=4058 RepID=A0ACC0CAX0_CATRO|nr:hypothetical protein M9H77_03314 [Catharanthus roseus]